MSQSYDEWQREVMEDIAGLRQRVYSLEEELYELKSEVAKNTRQVMNLSDSVL